MTTQNLYTIVLKGGAQKIFTREEEEGKSVIGLWKWSQSQRNPIIIDFNEAVVLSTEIAIIYRPLSEIKEEDQVYSEGRSEIDFINTSGDGKFM